MFTTDGGLVPARVVHTPWLSKPQANGEDVALVLESEIGTVEIGGEIPDNTTALVIDVP